MESPPAVERLAGDEGVAADRLLAFGFGHVGHEIASRATDPGDLLRRRPGAAGGGRNNERFSPIKNEGDRVERKSLTPWDLRACAAVFE